MGHGSVVGVAHRQVAARPQDSACFDEGGDRVGQVLEDLMAIDDVEGGVCERELVDVGLLEPDVPDVLVGGEGPGGGQGLFGLVDPDGFGRCHVAGEADGD